MLLKFSSDGFSSASNPGSTTLELVLAALAFTSAAYFGAHSSLNVERALDRLRALEVKRCTAPASPDLASLPAPSSGVRNLLGFLGVFIVSSISTGLAALLLIKLLPDESSSEVFARVTTVMVTVYFVTLGFDSITGLLRSWTLKRDCRPQKDDPSKLQLGLLVQSRETSLPFLVALFALLFSICVGIEVVYPQAGLTLLDASIAIQAFKFAQTSISAHLRSSSTIIVYLIPCVSFSVFNVYKIVSPDRSDPVIISSLIGRMSTTFLSAFIIGNITGLIRRFESHKNGDQLPWVDDSKAIEKAWGSLEAAKVSSTSVEDEQLDATWSVPVVSSEPLSLPPPLTRQVLAFIPACYLVQILCKHVISSSATGTSSWTIETLAYVDGVRTASLVTTAYLMWKVSRFNRGDQEERDALWAYMEHWALLVTIKTPDSGVDEVPPKLDTMDERQPEILIEKENRTSV